MTLSPRVALVTGSAHGIGRATALKLAEKGATVVVNDIGDIAPLEQLVGEIKSRGGQGIAVLADISLAPQVNQLVETAVSTFNRIDILVNNAGITRDQLLLRMSEEDWDSVIAIDLKSVFLCTKAVLKYMLKQRWGRIVNISSVVGLMGNAGQANYAAAKAGITGLTKSTAREIASRGITVNAIAPGFIDTGMTQRLSDTVKQEILKQIPVGAFGSPEDVANAVAFLASEEARYITGQVLKVDGGLVMA